MIEIPKDRNSLGCWLSERGINGSGAEIGCAWGGFSIQVLATWISGEKYYMVDTWKKLPSNEYLENQDSCDYDNWFSSCCKIADLDKRVTMIRMRSLEAAGNFNDESLDWAYIDSAHDFKNVSQDLNAWYPKVKRGGLLGGHDFMTKSSGHIEVDKAVEEFCYTRNLTFTVTPCTSWWLNKP